VTFITDYNIFAISDMLAVQAFNSSAEAAISCVAEA
jgi:hypothetical protein